MSGGQFYRVFPSLCVAGGAARYQLLLLSLCHLGARDAPVPLGRPGDRRARRPGSTPGLRAESTGPCLGPDRPSPPQQPGPAGSLAADVVLASPEWWVRVLLALLGSLLSWVCLRLVACALLAAEDSTRPWHSP